MSDEEKKAIEYLKRHIIPVYGSKGQIEYLLNDIVLNLIEKQQKEIEELNKENTRQHELIGNIHKHWEDKIKAKIEEVKDGTYDAKIVLQSLLEKE